MTRDSNTSWFLPENVQEFIPPQAESVDRLRRNLLDLYFGYGYQLVMPPMLEYRDALVSGTGTDLADVTLNLYCQPGERSLGLRADFTTQVARVDSQFHDPDSLRRYCYFGSTLLTKPRKPLASRNPYQAGVELFGSGSIAADQEMVELMIASIRQVIDQPIHIQLGHIGIFRRLCQLAQLSPAQAERCERIMRRRSLTDIRSFCQDNVQDQDIADGLMGLPIMIGGAEMLVMIKEKLSKLDGDIASSLNHISQVCDAIAERDTGVELVIDLADVRGYSYHNALLYSCYYNNQLLAQGGRYDGIGDYFGDTKSATGFSIDVDSLVDFTASQATELVWIGYNQRESAEQWIEQHRSNGGRCIVALEGDEQPPVWCSHGLKQETNGWSVCTLQTKKNQANKKNSCETVNQVNKHFL